MRFPAFIMAVGLTLTCAHAPAHAEKRVALVIGNNRYVNLPPTQQLQTAVNDARAITAAIKQAGFEVISGENLGRQAFLAQLDAAAQKLAPDDMVFFFFAGHGVALDNTNYILPADIPAIGPGQIATLTGAAIKEDDITNRFLRAGARVAILVIDACRNNPFVASGTRGLGRSIGLEPVEPPSGVFSLYSAGRGEAALDRLSDADRNPNSVFTRALLPALLRPGLDLPGLALAVRKEVTRMASAVNHSQRPAYYDETSGDRIFLVGPGTTEDHPIAETKPRPKTALPGCFVRVYQYPLNPKHKTLIENIPATEILETGEISVSGAEVTFKEGGRAWTDEEILKEKRASGHCPAPTFPIISPTHMVP
jgi:Caspase domain